MEQCPFQVHRLSLRCAPTDPDLLVCVSVCGPLQILEKNFPLRSVSKTLTPSVPPRSPLNKVPPPSATQPKVSLAALGKRVLADQAVMAPIGLVLFIASMGIMEGRTTVELKEKYQDVSSSTTSAPED